MDNSGNSRISSNNKRFHILFLVLLLIFAGIRIHYHQYYTGRLTNDEGLYLTLGKDISEDFKIGPPKILLWERGAIGPLPIAKGFFRKRISNSIALYVPECNLRSDSTGKTWLYTTKHWYYGRPPVIPYLLGVSFMLFGVNETVADNLFLLISMLSILVVYALASLLYNPRIGFLTAFFFGLSPIHMFWSINHIKLLDIPLMTCMTLTILLVYLAVKRNSIHLYILSGLMLTISFLTKYPGGVLYPLLFGYIILSTGATNKQKFRAITIIFLSSLLTLTPWFFYNMGVYGNPVGSIIAEMELDKLTMILNGKHLNPLSTLNYYVDILIGFGVVLILLAFIGFIISLNRRSGSDILVLSYILILLFVFHILRFYELPRYLLPLLPFLSLLCAIGFNYLLNFFTKLKTFSCYWVILVMFLVALPIIHMLLISSSTYILYKSVPTLEITNRYPLIHRMLDTVLKKTTPPGAVVASPKFTQTNFYSDRLTTPLYTDEESINHFNISFFAISVDDPKYLSTLRYLMYNPRFEVIKKIEYINQTGYIFKVIDVEDGIYLDKANRIITNYTNKQFSVYKEKNDSPELIYSGFDGAVNSIDYIRVPNLIVRIDDVTPSTDVITLKEIACVCDRYGCDRIIWAVKPSTDDSNIHENNELISFLKDHEKNGDYVFIYGDSHNYGKSDLETQIALINRSKNQLESSGLHPVGFVPYATRFNNDTLKAVSMLNLKAFSARNGSYTYPGVRCYSHVQGYYSDVLSDWLRKNITSVVVVYPYGVDSYKLRDILASVKHELYPIPAVIYDKNEDFKPEM